MDKIIIDGLEFYGYHGLLPQEQALGQRFTVDLELYFDLRQAGLADEPDDTIDYARIAELVRTVVEGPSHKLIESLAEKVASEILAHFPVKEVLVRVKKPQAPLAFKFRWMAVEIRRKSE